MLLVVGGALAIATIPVVRAVGEGVTGSGGFGILVLTAVGFLPSATVLSAVPPAVVKLQLRDLDSTGATVGQLSAYGTAGAIVATFLTGFVLVAIAAVTTLIVTVGVLLVISGLALWRFSSRRGPRRDRHRGHRRVGVRCLALGGAVLLGQPLRHPDRVLLRVDRDRRRP